MIRIAHHATGIPAAWVVGILWTLIALPLPLSAQQAENGDGYVAPLSDGDYAAWPRMDADYQHLELDLEWHGGEEVEGSARYTLRLTRPEIRELRLQANRMDISTVRWNGDQVDWQVRQEELIVNLPEGAAANRDHRLRIDYVAEPQFGVHQSWRGTRWSSGLPGAHSHWLPVWDHPRNRFSMEVAIRIPATHQALFTGTRAGESVSEDRKEVRFYTEGDRSVPTLRFAIGEFDAFDLTAGRYRIELYAEPGVLNDEQAREWLSQAQSQLDAMSQQLQIHLPHRTLGFLYLEDDLWEMNPWGSGLNLLFERRGDVLSQIQRAIASQWFGTQRIAERWADTDAVHLLREWLLREADPAPMPARALDPEPEWNGSPYDSFDPARIGEWRDWLQSGEGAAMNRLLTDEVSDWFHSFPSLLRWSDFSEWVYEQRGVPMRTPPVLSQETTEEVEEAGPDTIRIRMDESESEETLTLQVERSGPSVDEAIQGVVRVVGLQGEEQREVTFRRATQEIVVPGGSRVESVIVTLEPGAHAELYVEMPIHYLLWQLREIEDPAIRRVAARGLAAHDENPDLQLALRDLLNAEGDPGVLAEMLRSLGDVVRGATGTDSLFRDRFTLDESEEIQLALVYAMRHYEGNNDVFTLLRRIVVSDVPISVKREAIKSLDGVRGETSFDELSRALFANEASEPVIRELLEKIALEDPDRAAERADAYLDAEYTFETRRNALRFLLNVDDSGDRWADRFTLWAGDRDPRIRYLMLEAVNYLSTLERERLLEERRIEEDDPRVQFRLR